MRLSSLKRWCFLALLLFLQSWVHAQVDQGYEDANGVSGTCPTNSHLFDDWGFQACNCTSYVAYRLRLNDVKHGSNNVLFHNTAWGVQWSHAYLWANNDRAGAVGVRVDQFPAVGSVAHWDKGEIAGGYGHVAYVQHIFTRKEDGRLDGIGIMEYNYEPHRYTYRRIGVRDKGYPRRFLHFEEKGRDSDDTNATCITGVNGLPNGGADGSFCWKHNGSNAECSSASSHHYFDYRTCQAYSANSSYCPAFSTNRGYTVRINGNGFPESIAPSANSNDFAFCSPGQSTASGTSNNISGRSAEGRSKLWRKLSTLN